jgi:hypothetical protein
LPETFAKATLLVFPSRRISAEKGGMNITQCGENKYNAIFGGGHLHRPSSDLAPILMRLEPN